MTIKRFVASLSAQVDTLVCSMENHEAIAECAINEARQGTARLNTQLKLHAQCVQRFVRDLEEMDAQITLWQKRARRCAAEENNREKALQCMQAIKNCQHQREHILGQLSQSQSLEVELREHLHTAEQQLLELQRKKASLSARSTRNQVLQGVQHGTSREHERDAMFVRWEEKILTEEYSQGGVSNSDGQLDASFTIEENRLILESELDELLATERKTGEV